MSRFDIDKMEIATPCTADWNQMKGDNRSRHCQECKLNVFNIESLTRAEAESLLSKATNGERVCMRFFRRQDGTVITKDCPVGVRIARRMKLKLAALRLAFSTLFLGSATASAANAKSDGATTGGAAIKEDRRLMGKMVAPTGHFGGIRPDPGTKHGQGYKPPRVKTLKEYEAEPLVGEMAEPAPPKTADSKKPADK